MRQDLLIATTEKLAAALWEYYESGEYVKPFQSSDVADCVVYHSAAAGAAAMAAGVLPAAGAVAAYVVAAGAIWKMYISICKIIGVDFKRNKLKTISTAALTNVVTQLAGVFAIEAAASFIPGAGIIVAGVGNFAVTYFAGLIFLITLTRIFKVKRYDIDDLSNEEWVASIKDAAASIDKKAMLKEAKNIFTEMRKDGSLKEAGENVDIEMEEEM